MTRSRLTHSIISIAGAALLLMGCTASRIEVSGDDSSGLRGREVAANGGEAIVLLSSDWRDLNLQTVVDANSQMVAANAYQTLLAQDANGLIIPALATSWEVSPTSIVFTIGKGSTCTDSGTSVTPSVVAGSLQRLIDTNTPSNKINWGPGPWKVRADDSAGTVTFETLTPHGSLEYGFSNTFQGVATGIVCPAGLEPGADLATRTYGSGPYRLREAVHGDHVTFELRDNFVGGPNGLTSDTPGVPQKLTYRVVTNPSTAAGLLESGEIDIASVVGTSAERLLHDPSFLWTRSNGWFNQQLVFNETAGHPTTDPALRQALITAFDPEDYLHVAFRGLGEVSRGVATEDTQCFAASVRELAPTPSVEDARSVLTSSGYTYQGATLTKDGRPVAVRLIWDANTAVGAEYIAGLWSKLGIEVLNDTAPWQQWVTSLVAGEWDSTIITTNNPGPILGPASARFTGQAPPAGSNFARIADPKLDEIRNRANGLVGDAACADWAAFQERMWTEWHTAPTVAPYTYVFSKNFAIESPVVRDVLGVHLRRLEP